MKIKRVNRRKPKRAGNDFLSGIKDGIDIGVSVLQDPIGSFVRLFKGPDRALEYIKGEGYMKNGKQLTPQQMRQQRIRQEIEDQFEAMPESKPLTKEQRLKKEKMFRVNATKKRKRVTYTPYNPNKK